jgi:hypothetical protein
MKIFLLVLLEYLSLSRKFEHQFMTKTGAKMNLANLLFCFVYFLIFISV